MTIPHNLDEQAAAARALLATVRKDAYGPETPANHAEPLQIYNAVKRVLFAGVTDITGDDDRTLAVAIITAELGQTVGVHLNALPVELRGAVMQQFFERLAEATENTVLTVSAMTGPCWPATMRGTVQ